MTKKIFISYSHKDSHIVQGLTENLTKLQYSVWYDQKLSGGQKWWDEIIGEIVKCDLFICILSQDYLNSVPCALERDYSHLVGKTILPVEIGDNLSYKDLPTNLSTRQISEYALDDTGKFTNLLVAIMNAPLSPNPPNPLPNPPPPPINPIQIITEKLNNPAVLSDDEQHSILSRLHFLLETRESEVVQQSKMLLDKLKQTAKVNWIKEQAELLLNPPHSEVLIFGFFWIRSNSGNHRILVRDNNLSDYNSRLPIVKYVKQQNIDVTLAVDEAISNLLDTLGIAKSAFITANPKKPDLIQLYDVISDDVVSLPLFLFRVELDKEITIPRQHHGRYGRYMWRNKQSVTTTWREPQFIFGKPDSLENQLPSHFGNIYNIVSFDKMYRELGNTILEGVDSIIFRLNHEGKPEFLLTQRLPDTSQPELGSSENDIQANLPEEAEPPKRFGAGEWEYCKGGLFYHESDFEAALREISEELSISPVELLYCGSLGEQIVDVSGRKRKYQLLRVTGIVFYYKGDGTGIKVDGKHVEYNPKLNWISYDEAHTRIAWLEARYGQIFFERFAAQQADILKFVTENINETTP